MVIHFLYSHSRAWFDVRKRVMGTQCSSSPLLDPHPPPLTRKPRLRAIYPLHDDLAAQSFCYASHGLFVTHPTLGFLFDCVPPLPWMVDVFPLLARGFSSLVPIFIVSLRFRRQFDWHSFFLPFLSEPSPSSVIFNSHLLPVLGGVGSMPAMRIGVNRLPVLSFVSRMPFSLESQLLERSAFGAG